jgi:DNA modification methylase
MTNELIGKVHCCHALTLLRQIKECWIDAVIADPDWGCGLPYEFGVIADNAKDHWRKLQPVYRELLRVLKPHHPLAMFQSCKYWQHFGDWFGPIHLQHNYITAIKFGSFYPEVVVLQSKERTLYPTSCNLMLEVYTSQDKDFLERFGQHHPSPRSIAVMRSLVRMLSKPGELILDPFLGSGTTALACELEGRRWIGGDFWKPYCKLSEDRLEEIRNGHR